MASFGWKRKIGEKVSKAVSQHFEEEAADESVVLDSHEVDWLHAIKRKKGILLEDNTARSKRLKEEGSLLAEDGRHKEALTKWDEAIQLTPEDAALYEMKAQVLMGVHEIFPAVQAAETAVQRNPRFVEAWQTLGRAQLGLGEITMGCTDSNIWFWTLITYYRIRVPKNLGRLKMTIQRKMIGLMYIRKCSHNPHTFLLVSCTLNHLHYRYLHQNALRALSYGCALCCAVLPAFYSDTATSGPACSSRVPSVPYIICRSSVVMK
uniref:Tetratricopeptide repeat domain 33 n=1 Tax=Xenopus tropicalis TaxID=8364 RepID=A0A803J3U9_XENTR